jgi:hypothetical protein
VFAVIYICVLNLVDKTSMCLLFREWHQCGLNVDYVSVFIGLLAVKSVAIVGVGVKCCIKFD